MLDTTLLDGCLFDFIVVSDTHYMRVSEGQAVEMESRRRQSARALHALKMVACGSPSFVVHLGDLVQEFPESEGFTESLQQAMAQLDDCGLRPRHVAGNHDVGDKPDPTMPTDWVSSESLASYHDAVGPSWCSWDVGGYHFVTLNSQIMNSGLREEREQAKWLEADLAGTQGEPVVVFLHLAPFLVDRLEPGLAHYDNISEPARGWLLDLLGQHDVQLLFAGHSHFQFYNRIGQTRSYVVPSTSFTRPGFSEAFSSVAPPEQGRDDTGKLGFFLVRMHHDGPRIHRIRTNGHEGDPDRSSAYVVSRLPTDLPSSPLGVVARHQIAPAGMVPVAWPSMIRQPMRNDYPLLACTELGARHVRVPADDVFDSTQRERLSIMRAEGIQVTATWIWSENLDLGQQVREAGDVLDFVELQIPDSLWPDADLVRNALTDVKVQISWSPLMPRDIVPGKQHARARIGFRVSELDDLERHLENHDLRLDRILLRVDAAHSPWEIMEGALTRMPLAHVRQIDWLVDLGTTNSHDLSIRVAEAFFGAALHTGCRVFLDPLADLDRTMDVCLGLIDRMSNPNPAFNVSRVLNSVLFRDGPLRRWASHPAMTNAKCHGLESDNERYLLILPLDGPVWNQEFQDMLVSIGECRIYDLERGMSYQNALPGEVSGPILAVYENSQVLNTRSRARDSTDDHVV